LAPDISSPLGWEEADGDTFSTYALPLDGGENRRG